MLRPLSRSTLLPYTTLFRSGGGRAPMRPAGTGRVRREIQGGGLVGGGRGAGQREYSGEQSRGPNIGRHGRRGAGVRRGAERTGLRWQAKTAGIGDGEKVHARRRGSPARAARRGPVG